ncbi:MAG: hypothetical protein LBE38_09380 [Deltaproteobacteria bacterium]|jgi:hypothetical protein|nr:hypothetical protein [Deltaproteobacteria bacterium]
MLNKFSIISTFIVIILTATILYAQSQPVLPSASGLNWVPFEYKGQPQNVTVMVPSDFKGEYYGNVEVPTQIFRSQASVNQTFDDNITLTLNTLKVPDIRNATGSYDEEDIEAFKQGYIQGKDNVGILDVTQNEGKLILNNVIAISGSLNETLITQFQNRRLVVNGEIMVILACHYIKESALTKNGVNDTDFQRINNNVCSPYLDSLTFK